MLGDVRIPVCKGSGRGWGRTAGERSGAAGVPVGSARSALDGPLRAGGAALGPEHPPGHAHWLLSGRREGAGREQAICCHLLEYCLVVVSWCRLSVVVICFGGFGKVTMRCI